MDRVIKVGVPASAVMARRAGMALKYMQGAYLTTDMVMIAVGSYKGI